MVKSSSNIGIQSFSHTVTSPTWPGIEVEYPTISLSKGLLSPLKLQRREEEQRSEPEEEEAES